MTRQNRYILDASAIIALIANETGAEQVEKFIGNASISSVNASEVMKFLMSKRAYSMVAARNMLEQLIESILPFSFEDCCVSAELTKHTDQFGLSFGDRACLGTAMRMGYTVITADRVWQELPITHPKIICIR